MSLTTIDRKFGETNIKKPLSASFQHFVKKIESVIKLVTGKTFFSFSNKEKNKIYDLMTKMAIGIWQPEVKLTSGLSKRERLRLIDEEKNKGCKIYTYKIGNIRYNFRIKFICKTYFTNNISYDTKKTMFAINIRIHHSDIDEKFINIAKQIGTIADFSISPQESNFKFLVDLNPPKT